MRRPLRLSFLLVAAAILFVLLRPEVAFAGGDGEFSDYEGQGWALMYLASFGFGFLTSLTPCVYPMIPITLAIFGARGKDVTKRRAILLATAYIVGMGATYSILGVTFALLGDSTGFGSQLGHPAIVIPLVILFLALAASMFGAFELNLPSGIQARLNQIGGKGFGGAFAMGLVGGLIAAPCTGPFLAGLLAYVSTTGSVVGGGSLLFVYALGMGVLFWVLAAFAVAMPKSGAWMDAVKSIGGVGLLLAALYFLRPLSKDLRTFASPEIWFLAVSIGLALAGILLGAIHLSFHGPTSHKVRKAIGVALLVAGAFGAWTWKLTPKQHLPWIYAEETKAYDLARAQGKGVMVDFSATWCVPCDELELTFGDADVYDAITSNFIPLKFDVTEGTDEQEAIKARYQAGTLPAVVFLDSEGNRLAHIKKMMEPDEMLRVVRPAIKKLHATPSAQTSQLPTTPVAHTPSAPAPAPTLPWIRGDEPKAFELARTQNKGVMINFAAAWSVPSQELTVTLGDATVRDAITTSFIPLEIDVSDGADEHEAIKQRYKVTTIPSVVFVDTQGNHLGRISQLMDPAELLGIVQPAIAKLRAPTP